MSRQETALCALEVLQTEWQSFCVAVLSERSQGVAYKGANAIVKNFGDAFFEQLERYVNDL